MTTPVPDPSLAELGATASALALAALRTDRHLAATSLTSLGDDPWPAIHALTGVSWRWRLDVVERSGRMVLGFGRQHEHSLLHAEASCRLVPSAIPPPQPQVGFLEQVHPPLMLQPSSQALAQAAPGGRVSAQDTVLLQLASGVLAVKNPARLLGPVFRAKLWWRGKRLQPHGREWPAQPFLELLAAVGQWLDTPDAGETRPLVDDRQDVLAVAVHDLAASYWHLAATLAQQGAEGTLGHPWLGPLGAALAIDRFAADLRLRLDTAGELASDDGEETVLLRAALTLQGTDPQPRRLRLQLEPPELLARDDTLEALVAALRDDRGAKAWDRIPDLDQHLLPKMGASSRVAFRLRRRGDEERWCLVLPAMGESPAVLRADFAVEKDRPAPEASTPGAAALSDADHDQPHRLPTAVQGGRKVLHHPEEALGAGTLDDATVRALLRLITALQRYGRVVG